MRTFEWPAAADNVNIKVSFPAFAFRNIPPPLAVEHSPFSSTAMTQSLGLSGFGMLILAAKTIESNDTTAFNSVAPVNYYNVQAPQVASSETARPRAHGYVLRNTTSTPTPSPVVLQTPREEAEPPAPSPARGGLKRVTRKGVPQKIARATPPRAAKARASGNAAAVEPPQKETVVTRKTASVCFILVTLHCLQAGSLA